jgi:hypothetical protein
LILVIGRPICDFTDLGVLDLIGLPANIGILGLGVLDLIGLPANPWMLTILAITGAIALVVRRRKW